MGKNKKKLVFQNVNSDKEVVKELWNKSVSMQSQSGNPFMLIGVSCFEAKEKGDTELALRYFKDSQVELRKLLDYIDMLKSRI